MLISYNWLKKYLPEISKYSSEEIAKKISWSLAEVEKVENKGVGLANIYVGEILSVTEHPQNPKLCIAKVSTGNNKQITVIFAASNKEFVTVGSLFPVCLAGGSVYDTQGNIKKIEKTELGGIISEGMLCSLAELGLEGEKRGISLVEDNLPAGTDLIPMLQDYIFEIENKSITHRPDCFSHRGIAREISAMFELEFKSTQPEEAVFHSENKLKVNILANDICSRFTCVCMQDVEVTGSPTWLKIYLYNLGQKPVNNIVDISNYIMMDIGQPMHIYDFDKFNSDEIILRRASKGEKIKAINHKTYELKPNHLLIANNKDIQGIAGIMGSANSEVDNQTKNILIEAASFDMFNIRKTAMELGLQSDASTRYSKGLTNTITKEAIVNAIQIITDTCHAEIDSELIDVITKPENSKEMEFNLNNIKRIGGINIDKSKIISILESLNIEVSGAENFPVDLGTVIDAIVNLKIPAYRKDLNIVQDIVEEVIRIYGYDRIKPDLPYKAISPTRSNPDYIFTYLAKEQLVASGLDEVYTYSFIGGETYRKAGLDTSKLIKVINAIAPELEYFRDHLLPSLIEKLSLNSTNFDEFGFFEISRILKQNSRKEIPDHIKKIAIVEFVKKGSAVEILKNKLTKFLISMKLDSYKMRNLYNQNTTKLSKDLQTDIKLFHPLQAAIISFGSESAGVWGSINPEIVHNYDIDGDIAAAYLDYETLYKIYNSLKPSFSPINYFPKVSRDVSYILQTEEFDVDEILEVLDQYTNPILSLWDAEYLDKYTDENNQQYLTIRYNLQKLEGTLSEKEIDQIIQAVNDIASQKFSITLRTK